MKNRWIDFIIFIILLLSQDSLIYGPIELRKYNDMDKLLQFKYIVLVILVCIGIYRLISHGVIKLNKKSLIYAIFFISYILMSMIVNHDYEGEYALVAIFCALLVVNNIDSSIFLNSFKRVIIFVSIISSIVNVLFVFFKAGMDSFTYRVISSGHFQIFSRFLGKCYEPGYGFNAAIFRERGVFCFYLTIAIICVLRNNEEDIKQKIIQIIILGLTMLTTRGSSGFIAISVLVLGSALYFPFWGKYKARTFVLMFIVILCGLLYFKSNYELVLLKLNSSSDFGDSGITRYASIIIAGKAILLKPFIGMGVAHFESFFNELITEFPRAISRVFTNTLLGLGAYWGIPICIFSTVGVYEFSKEINSKIVPAFCVFGAIIVNLFCQSEVCVEFFWCIVFYGLMMKNRANCVSEDNVNYYENSSI